LPLDGACTLPEAFARSVERFADGVALRAVGSDRVYTWREYGELVADYAGGLTGLGVLRGDAVGLMLANRPEFFLIDTAAQHLGATPCSVYNTSSPEQLAHMLEDSANRVMVTESRFLPTVRAATRLGGRVEHIVVIDGPEDGALGLDDLAERAPAGFDLAAVASTVEPGDVATLIYTSGTTGSPKGVELTHANLLAAANMLVRVEPLRPGGRLISYLPSAHIADRTWGLYLTNKPRPHRDVLPGPHSAGRGPDGVPTNCLWRGTAHLGEIQGEHRGRRRLRPAAGADGVRRRLRRQLGAGACRTNRPCDRPGDSRTDCVRRPPGVRPDPGKARAGPGRTAGGRGGANADAGA
jgi:hypothetical protein